MRIRTSLWVATASLAAVACSSNQQGPAAAQAVKVDRGDRVIAELGAATPRLARPAPAARQPARRTGRGDGETASPIKHVVVIVGENRTFDHVYATYKPKGDQRIWNLLSRGIIKEDGTPGPRFHEALQRSAVVSGKTFEPAPRNKTPYAVLPPALAGGPKVPYIPTVAEAAAVENGLPASDVVELTTGGTGLASGVLDTRLPNAATLPPGPFQLTPGIGYDDYAASPVHRFYQMWQQLDCSAGHATWENPSGCLSDLFPWVEVTIGAGSNGKAQPGDFSDTSTHEGSTSMGFYNVLQGDAPYFKQLADDFAMSDNFHQAIQGGTGANHVALGTGDAIWFSDGAGKAIAPPALNTENPDPQPGTNNWYTQDGYSGGTYSACADDAQPGVGPISRYLRSVGVDPNCDEGHYYLLNNYNPGYLGDGTVATTSFTIPPSTLRTIGDELLEHEVSWRYYGDQWDRYVDDPTGSDPTDIYCNICNPFQYATSIMTDAGVRTTHLKDTIDLYDDIQNGWLPAFSIVKPSGLVDGHPASSKLELFEGFSQKIVDLIKANPALWEDTAIFVTFDEGGGYYDSGYVAPIDFFGDGTRIPFVVASPHARPGYVSHEYTDHVSILKFVERNWRLPPITDRSRDNLPSPRADRENPWVPRNGPSLGDLFDLFDFAPRGRD